MHFVNKDTFDDIYVSSGALVDHRKIITTRDFLEPYEKNVNNSNLFVYPSKWKIPELKRQVVKVYIDHQGGSKLVVAKVSSFTCWQTRIHS